MESIKLKILEEKEKGNVVLMTIDGYQVMRLDDLINQPAAEILYDLNRDETTALTLMGQEGGSIWVNNFACAQVIKALKKRIEELENEKRK